uniref:Epidermal growth factor n=1 Tax=Gouania willdenowi TaxID=441366 RepID=A0A8C5HL45_GOUWI
IGLDGKHHRRLVTGVGGSILLDFHFNEERVYWADRHAGVIYKASVGGANRKKLYSSDKHISGLAVDWISNSVYWTSGRKGEIKSMNIDGQNQRTLVRHLPKPSSINVDPIIRFLFWLCGGTASTIQRSDVTGRMKVTLITTAEHLKALSIDREDKRLFWVQFGLQGENKIGSCDYDGNALHIIDQREILGLTVFMEYIYYTNAAAHDIKQVSKYTGGDPRDVNSKQLAKPPDDIKVVHSLNQPMADAPSPDCDEKSGNCVNICSSLAEPGVCKCSDGFSLSKQGTYCEDVNECAHWNHGCSLGCENIPGSFFCTCPKGYALLPDRKTCQEIVPCWGNMTCGNGCLTTGNGSICVCPEGSVLQEGRQICTGCSSVDRGGCSQSCTPITPTRWQCSCQPGYQLHQDGKQCTATGPPPYLLVASLVGVQRINTDGSQDQTVVTDPRGNILAVDYDPVDMVTSGGHVYFASTTRRTIERIHLNDGQREVLVSDGLSSVEGLFQNGLALFSILTNKDKLLYRKTIIDKGLEEPRGIAVHPLAKKLFWTDVGSQPAVERANLEGTDRVVIANTNLVSPTGLTIDFTEDQVFWCDQRKGLIESAALDGSDRRVISENQVGRPFDLTVFEDSLWISDWERQQLRSVHKRTGRKLQVIHTAMVQPSSIVMVHPLTKPGMDACLHLNGGCAQLCESKMGLSHCSCQPHFVLSADGKSCFPSSFSDTSSSTSLSLIYIVTLCVLLSDQHECDSLGCDVSARCVLDAGTPRCVCLEGFTGDGWSCVGEYRPSVRTQMSFGRKHRIPLLSVAVFDVDQIISLFPKDLKSTSPRATSISPREEVTTQQHIGNSVMSCPSSHESYCLYQGVCFYFPEMESYACNCMSGYLGERCQFNDLEWLELHQAEKEKRRNVVIAACMVVLISLLSIIACVTYFLAELWQDSINLPGCEPKVAHIYSKTSIWFVLG